VKAQENCLEAVVDRKCLTIVKHFFLLRIGGYDRTVEIDETCVCGIRKSYKYIVSLRMLFIILQSIFVFHQVNITKEEWANRHGYLEVLKEELAAVFLFHLRTALQQLSYP
jgi:hypothetical protein